MDANTTALHELSRRGIWIGDRVLWLSGVRLRSRMTVIRLADGLDTTCEPTLLPLEPLR